MAHARGSRLTEEQKRIISIRTKEAMARPDVRSRTNAGIRAAYADPVRGPGLRKAVSDRWKNPEFRAKVHAGRPNKWTKKQHKRLKKLYTAGESLNSLAIIFKRSPEAVKGYVSRFGFHRNKQRKIWTEAEIGELRKLYSDTDTAILLEKFNCKVGQLYNTAARHGLKKSAEYTARILAECGRQIMNHPNAIAARLKPGNVPPNKGKKMPAGWSPGRMRETQFRKGERAGAAQQKWVPVGTVTMRDGYMMMKVKDDPEAIAGKGALRTNWMYVHKMVWETAHGMIPRGHRIWWKDRDHLNCALENIELLTDKEHMARTTLHNLPPKLKRVIVLKGAIKRRITMHERKKANGKR
jgi:hypothetical protein